MKPNLNLLLPLVIAIVAIGYAAISLRNNSAGSGDGYSTDPTIGHVSGPWPACVGKSFASCAHIIQQATALHAAHSPLHMVRVKPSDPSMAPGPGPVKHDRIRIFVDEQDVVLMAPKRG